MPFKLPKEPKKIRERIKRYERIFAKERDATGWYSDGFGKRYLLGPLYLLMSDLEGAIKSFCWFQSEFPDDMGEAGHSLCWSLALYRNGELKAASKKLKQTMLMNLFIVPHLLGLDIAGTKLEGVIEREDTTFKGMCHSGEESFYIDEIPKEYFTMWGDGELAWALSLYQSADFQAAQARLIEIQQELETVTRGPRRTELVEQMFSLKK